MEKHYSTLNLINRQVIPHLVKLAAQYDPYAEFIDDSRHYKYVTERNEAIMKEAIETAALVGGNIQRQAFIDLAHQIPEVPADLEQEAAKWFPVNPEDETVTCNIITINHNENKEETIMTTTKTRNDYTLGGKLPSTDWDDFRKELMDRWHIDVYGKKFVELKAMAEEALAREAEGKQPEVAPAPVAPAAAPTVDIHNFVIEAKYGDAIIQRIVFGGKDRNGKSHGPAVYTATKSQDPESKGKLMVTMNRLFAIIGDVYGVTKDDPNGDATIKGAIRTLCKCGYLHHKKYEDGGMAFFPTERMTYKAVQLAHTRH